MNGPICPWSALYASTAPSLGVHIHNRTLSVLNPFSVVRYALFVTITVVPVALIQCYRTWVGKILRHVGRSSIWQCFKTKTGNVRISFQKDLREVHCPYLTRGSAQHPFQFQRYSSAINSHKYSFFVRTVPAWNALSPVSVRADSVAVFHSSIWNVKDYLSFLSSDISKLLRVISRAVKAGSHMPPMYLRRSRRYHLGYFSHEWEYARPTTRAIAVVYRRHACEVELESNSQACRR